MTDVFTALVGAIANCIGPENCQKCEYRDIRTKTRCKTMLLRDALELLNGREPVSPIPYQQDTSIGFFAGFKCGSCNAVVFPDYRFCPICGKAVKWDE